MCLSFQTHLSMLWTLPCALVHSHVEQEGGILTLFPIEHEIAKSYAKSLRPGSHLSREFSTTADRQEQENVQNPSY